MNDPFEAIAGEREARGASDDLGLTASRSANAIINRLKNAIETGEALDLTEIDDLCAGLAGNPHALALSA